MQKNQGKKGNANEQNQLLFQDRLPETILQELTPEIRRQYFLWDEIIKREVQLHPGLVLPLIAETFGREYQQDVKIELLSTEYSVRRIHEKGEKVLHSIFSDLLIKVGKELYHLECQMEENREMVLRMLEYDVHIALVHGKRKHGKAEGQEGSFELALPHSVILCLDHADSVPDYEQCTIRFPDGTLHSYRVPVIKVQQYTPEMIAGRHLNMLIPFLPIRFRSALRSTSRETRERARKDLTGLLAECIMILKREKADGILTEETRNDIAEFLVCACDYLYGEDSGLIQEVHAIMEPAIKLRREIAQENKLLQEDIKVLERDIKTLTESNKGLQESNKDLEESNRDLQESNKDLEKSNQTLQEKLQNHDRKLENSIAKMIYKAQSEGKTQEEIQRILQEIFDLNEAEARRKLAESRES